MAVYFQDMTSDETVALTRAMLDSGEHYDLSHIPGSKVDKHSTGGVGDKVSLLLAPLAAACGLKVPMMAGRGLGHSGGTIDKLQAIPGFRVDLSRPEFERVLQSIGCVLIGQSSKIAPADKKLYALRDVTATIECIPLIVASILSKKLAEGAETLILDVKVGSGAFMKTLDQAKRLARGLTQVAKKMGIKCRALITNMDQPLGYAAGNSVEILETIAVLRNERQSQDLVSTDLKELTIQLCAQMLEAARKVKNLAEGRTLARKKLEDGSAWNLFREMVMAQGGDVSFVDHPEKLALAPQKIQWKAKKRGYITHMQTDALGHLLVEMGGGRKRAEDSIDPGVGILFHHKLGAQVSKDEPLATVYAKAGANLAALETQFQSAIEIRSSRKPVPKLILAQIEGHA